MADSLGDVIINLRSRDVNMKSGLDGIRHELEHLSSHIFSFGGLLHIAFGTAAARAIFHELHHVIKEVAEGFSEGEHAGLGFAGSIGVGVEKALGMRTALDDIASAEKVAAENAKELANEAERALKAAREHRDLTEKAGESIRGGTRNIVTGRGTEDEDSDTPNSERQGVLKEYDKKIQKNGDDLEDNARKRKKLYEDEQRKIEARHHEGKHLSDGEVREEQGILQAQDNALMAEHNRLTKEHLQLQNERLALETRLSIETESDEKAKKEKEKTKELDAKMRQEGHEADEFFRKQKEGEKTAAQKELEHKMQELDRFIESEMQKQAKSEEQAKHDDESAKRIRDSTDPTAKLKDEFTEIARLVGIGKLTEDEAQKARKRDVKEFNQANQRDNKIEFRSADVAANDMLKKSLEEASLQKETNVLLQQISDKIGKPGTMV